MSEEMNNIEERIASIEAFLKDLITNDTTLKEHIDKKLEDFKKGLESDRPVLSKISSKSGTKKPNWASVDETIEKCRKAEKEEDFTKYPCAYTPISGKYKLQCCGAPATTYYDREKNEQTELTSFIPECDYYSLKCPPCTKKGSKGCSEAKFTEALRNTMSEVQEAAEAIGFISGRLADEVASPSKAKAIDLEVGLELVYDKTTNKKLYAVNHDGTQYALERAVTKDGSPKKRNTPCLRGIFNVPGDEEISNDNYEDYLEEEVSEEQYHKIMKVRKVKYDGEEKFKKSPRPVKAMPKVETEETNPYTQETEDSEGGDNGLDDALAELGIIDSEN